MDNAQRLTGKQAVSFIQSRTQVNKPGKYTLQVIGSNFHNGKIILNLKAQDSKGLEAAKEHLRNGRFDDAANTNMSTNVFEDAAYIPSKGEFINCMVAEVPTRDGGTKLGIVSISEVPTEKSTKISLGDEFASFLDEVEEANEVAEEEVAAEVAEEVSPE